MRAFSLRALPLAALAMGLLLSGCPLLSSPVLNATPKALTFGENASNQFIDVLNSGGGTLSWTLSEVARADEDAPWVATAIPFLSASATSGTTQQELDRVILTVNRAGLPVGTFNNIGVRIASNGGTEVIPIALVVRPTLTASPASFALASEATSAQFTVTNSGDGAANWDVLFLPNPDNLESSIPLPSDFTVTPNPGNTAAGQSTTVNVEWGAGRSDFYLLLRSDAGSTVLSFFFGSALEGLEIRPSTLRVFVTGTEVPDGETQPDQPISKLRIGNVSAITRTWTVQLRSIGGSNSAPPISITPNTGSTAPAQESAVEVRVTDITKVELGSGNYELLVSSGGTFVVVPLIVEKRSLPIIATSEPPAADVARPEIVELSLLDFGRDELSLEFWVANTGPRDSRLYFEITNPDAAEATPLIVDISPLRGDTTNADPDFFFPPGSNELIDGTPIRVTIDRSALRDDVEFRDITITAFDADYLAPLDAVEPVTVTLRAERQPLTIEGADNRARPPFLMRFVFLLRDTLNKVVPTETPEDLDRLAFSISENEVALDINESNSFVTGPAGLRTNLVLMLDFTGSIYNAGTDDPENPIAPGVAVAQVRAAALKFLDDVPPGYRVALMYHNDRQQRNRLITNFTTDREALKTALANFNLPPSQFGVTTIYDALIDAVGRLAAEDAGETLPFNDADVRAVVFITDGRDQSSIASVSEVQDAATETRTRLFPLVYTAGSQSSMGDLITLASETGGHLYNARQVQNLSQLLANARGLALEPSSSAAANAASFRVVNTSTSTLTWSATKDPGADWITTLSPAGGELLPGASEEVTLNLSPAAIGLNTTRSANITIATGNNTGAGVATVQATVAGDISTIESTSIALEDEPGEIWNDLRNQVVLTYVTPSQTGGTYNITARYTQPAGGTIANSFERDGVFFSGDVLAGQISLVTDGIIADNATTDPARQVRAEVLVRTDYVPRDVSRFRMRFFATVPEDAPAGAQAALDAANIQVELAPEGLLASGTDPWRLLAEPDGSYIALTSEDNALQYGAFGNLLRITVTNLRAYRDLFTGSRAPEFLLQMRVDNQIYVDPATSEEPSRTKYFLYPGGPTYPGRALSVSTVGDVAGPAQFAVDLANPGIDPEAPNAWDRDEDGLPDFNDPQPDDDFLPATLVTPNPVNVNANVNSVTFTVRNLRLDTFTWSVTPDATLPWATLSTVGSNFTLAPGQTSTFTLSLNRTGIPTGFYPGTLVVDTDTFGTEQIPLTIVVNNP